mgnify:CR=1 FL=1
MGFLSGLGEAGGALVSGAFGLGGAALQNQQANKAAELQQQLTAEHDAELQSIDCCHAGERVAVRGMVRSLTVRPADTVPALEIELYDGTGAITVVWLGRRRMSGIEAGRTMVVHGRLTGAEGGRGQCTMFNPRYELKPMHA